MIQKKYGFILLYRDFINWEWYSDSNTFRLFIHCLLLANHTQKEWKGVTIPAGSFVTSLGHLAKELSLSVRQIRTALNHLISTNIVTHNATVKYSIITINNYSMYQSIDKVNDKQSTKHRQSKDKLTTTTNKEYKEKKENKENYDIDKIFQKLEEIYK